MTNSPNLIATLKAMGFARGTQANGSRQLREWLAREHAVVNFSQTLIASPTIFAPQFHKDNRALAQLGGKCVIYPSSVEHFAVIVGWNQGQEPPEVTEAFKTTCASLPLNNANCP